MIPVHNHSEYSALDGYSHPSEIADRIEALGLPGCFLTDHGTVAGWQSFTKAMKEKGLFVGYGMEAYQAQWSRFDHAPPGEDKKFVKGQDAFHLVLLAVSPEGYKNLLRISDESNRTGSYYAQPRADLELLRKYREGIVATTACMGSLVNKQIAAGGPLTALDDLVQVYGEDLLIELHTYDTDEQREINKILVREGRDLGLRYVYANDAHYATPDQWMYHEALMCAQMRETLDGPKRYENFKDTDGVGLHNPPCLYIMGEEDVRAALQYLPESVVDEAIETSDWLAERATFDLEPKTLHLPKFKSPTEDIPDNALFLIDLVEQGMEQLYGHENDEAWERAEFELKAIIEAGLHDYFLIVWDFIQHAQSKGQLVGAGRGSVGGWIVAYALDITTVDPLKYNLQFERFWNPGRAEGLPDIDIDFEKSRRDEMVSYVTNRYGENRVLRIGNHSRMRPMMAIDKAGMVLYERPPYDKAAGVKALMKSTIDAGLVPSWDEMMADIGDRDEIQKFIDKYPDIFGLAKALSGRVHTYGVHASAVVISDIDLKDYLPTRMAKDDENGKKKVLCTQAEMHEVEDLGFPKFDFLGLRNLDTVMKASLLSEEFGKDTVETRQKIAQFFRHGIDWDDMPDEFWEQIDNGSTLGLFQIEESPAPRKIGRRLKPRTIEDLAFIVAVNRPGPLRDKVPDRYLDRKEGKEAVLYPHAMLETILEPTFGDFIYQEQVIDYFKDIGYSLSDADHIRKILGKKLDAEMQAELPTYLKFAGDYMSEQQGKAIWNKIEQFSKYSFNKAHAIGYGLILAWTMYAKWRWPTQFILAGIETNAERVASWVNEARRIGVTVLPPDVNRSSVMIKMDGEEILYGLRDIGGLGVTHAKWIVQNGPYDSPEHFYELASEAPIVVNAGHRAKLMAVGAFDSFGYRLGSCSNCGGRGKTLMSGYKRKYEECSECKATGLERKPIPSPQERAQAEIENLGVSLTDAYAELVEQYSEEISALDQISDASAEEKMTVVVPGVVQQVKTLKAKWKSPPEDYARVTISWQGEDIEFVAWPDKYENFGFLLKPNKIGRFTLETGPKGPKLMKGFQYT